MEQQNKQSLDSLLSPLKEQLEGFRKQVNDNFNNEAKERHTLVHELRNLQSLNEQMAKEALNLTQALKRRQQAAKATGGSGSRSCAGGIRLA